MASLYKKVLFIAAIWGVSFSVAYAVRGDLVWQQAITHSSGYALPSVYANDATGVYLAGESGGACAGGWSPTLRGARWYVEKRNLDGSRAWQRSENYTNTSDCPREIELDATGVYISGVNNSGGGLAGGSTWRIEKRSKVNGLVIWSRVVGNIPTFDNGIVVDGTSVYGVGQYFSGNGYARIVRINKTNGALVWAENTVLGQGVSPSSIAVNGSGVYVAGTYGVTWGVSSGFVERRNLTNGNLVWRRTPNVTKIFGIDAQNLYLQQASFMATGSATTEKWGLGGSPVWSTSGNYTGISERIKGGVIENPGTRTHGLAMGGTIVNPTFSLTARNTSSGGPAWSAPLPMVSGTSYGYVLGNQGIYGIRRVGASPAFLQKRSLTNGALGWEVGGLPPQSFPVGIEGNDEYMYVLRTIFASNTSASAVLQKRELDGVPVLPPSNQVPTATITVPAGNITVASGSTVTFTGTGNDPDGTIAAYGWNRGGCGAGANISSASSFTKSDLPVGTNTIYFHVRDNSMAWSPCDSVTVTVTPAPSQPDLVASAVTPVTAVRNTPVSLSAQIRNIGGTATPSTIIGSMTTYGGTGAGPFGIASDGTNMWVTNGSANSVTKVSPTGTMTTYGGVGGGPRGIAFDGTNMWVANTNSNSVTRITPGGVRTSYGGTGGGPWDIAFDGTNMWTANIGSNSVTKITPAGGMTTYALPVGGAPWGIASDGTNMWVANYNANRVTKISPTGTMTTYSGTGSVPRAIAFDGTNMWTANGTALSGSSVTRISPTGGMTTYPLARVVTDIAFDGTNMWVTNNAATSVTKIGAHSGFQNFFQVASGANGGGTITGLLPSTISTLAAGASSPITRSYTFPNIQTCSARACADKGSASDAGTVVEASETNNCGPWQNITVSGSAPTAPTLTATTCTIAANASTCPGRVTWVIQNATTPNVYNQTRSASCGTGATGTNAPCTLGYGNNTIRARDNTTFIRDITVNAACVSSAPWNGTICAPAAPQCSDTTDNDGDGLNNYPADPGCSSATDTTESPNPACSNNSDDDGDGDVDVDDLGCENTSGTYDPRDSDEFNVPPTQCNDGIDNDSDSKIDWDGNGNPANADPGCTSAADTSEFNIGTIRPR